MSKIITKILTPALKLWLNSQVEKLETLNLSVEGSDYQFLSGYIPEIILDSHQLVYKGLSLEEIKLKARNIRINVGQMLRGQSLKLLKDIKISGEVAISNESLKASISSTMLQDSIKYLLNILLEHKEFTKFSRRISNMTFQLKEINIDCSNITIQVVSLYEEVIESITIKLRPDITSTQTLSLKEVEIRGLSGLDTCLDREILLDLGPDFCINQLSLNYGKLSCQCELKIYS